MVDIDKLNMKQRKKTFEELLDYICESIDMLHRNPKLYRFILDGIRNNIFYMASTSEFFTGMYSYYAYMHIVDGGSKAELCKEHHYSLKRLCNDIMYSNLSREEIAEVIKSKGTFNLTTKHENQKLKSNKQSYEKSGITLNTYNGWLCKQDGIYPVNETEYVDSIPEMYIDWIEKNRDKKYW